MVARKKIIYLITKGSFGGAQRYVYDLATSVADRFEVLVLIGQVGELNRKLEAAGIKIGTIKGLERDVNFFAEFKVFWQLFIYFKNEKPDIIHLNSSKIGGLGALAGRLAGVKKIIFTGHAWAFNEDRPWWQKWLITIMHWFTVMLCHRTIAVSEKTRRDLDHLPFLTNKFIVIRNGLQTAEHLPRVVARQKLAELVWKSGFDPNILDQTLIIGTISELHKNKGLDFLISALAKMKDKLGQTLIWIIGDGEEREHLRELIKREDLKDRVVLLGNVNDASQYLKAFDIFTLTSRTEALPYAILEAGAAHLPVIASAVGGIPEIISDFNLGILVRPGNLKELRLALSRLIDNPAERAKFGQTLAKKVNKDFSLKKMVAETAALYK